MGADPLTPVNAFITHGGQRANGLPGQLRRCGRYALRRGRPVARLRRVPQL